MIVFLQLTDPGNMAQDNDSQWFIESSAVIRGMFGILFFSAVIAFLTTQLELKLTELKKGRSWFLEKDHVFPLGVVLNPEKSKIVTLDPEDSLIVVAEDEY